MHLDFEALNRYILAAVGVLAMVLYFGRTVLSASRD